MSHSTGLPFSTCKKFINNYYKRYPEVKIWQDYNIEEVNSSRISSKYKTAEKYPAGMGFLKSITGRVYTFIEEDSPDFMRRGMNKKYTSFKPTKIKNYPVQGGAGDIVAECLGRLNRTINSSQELRGNCMLINTVHDSVELDCKLEYLYEGVMALKTTLESAPKWLKERYGLVFDLPLNIDIEIGRSWGEKLDLKVEDYL